MESETVNPLMLFGIIIGSMVIGGILLFSWAIWDDYKTGHTKHKEKFFGNDD